jgi:hypothetical protein
MQMTLFSTWLQSDLDLLALYDAVAVFAVKGVVLSVEERHLRTVEDTENDRHR